MAKAKKSRKSPAKRKASTKRRKSSGSRGTVSIPLRKYDEVMREVNKAGIVLRDREGRMLEPPPDADSLRQIARIRDPQARALVANLVKQNLRETYGLSVTQADMALTQKKMARLLMDVVDALPSVARDRILEDLNRRD